MKGHRSGHGGSATSRKGEHVIKKESADEFDLTSPGRYPRALRRLELPDEMISEVNNMLDWHAVTVRDGQVLGRLGTTPGKRTSPGKVPDYRIEKLDELVGLTGKS